MRSATWQYGWGPLRDIQREVDRIIEAVEPRVARVRSIHRALPPINLHDAGGSFVLTALVPGLNPDELDLSIAGETLTIRGERKRPEHVAEDNFRRQERRFGVWTRAITLPGRVAVGSVSARFDRGILTIDLPKAEDGRPRQISVTSGPSA